MAKAIEDVLLRIAVAQMPGTSEVSVKLYAKLCKTGTTVSVSIMKHDRPTGGP